MGLRFYTSVQRWGGYVLYRGYDDGKRIQERIKFKPTLFLPSKADKTIWTALDGTKVEPMRFDSMKEAKDFIDSYAGVQSMKIFGNTRWTSQYIQEEFPDETIHFDRTVINVASLDIEVKSNDGFPHPDDALHEITAICLKNNIDNIFHVWGCGEFDPEKSAFKDRVVYHQFSNEVDMLTSFVKHFSDSANTPDIITGWNVRLFDIPYLLNRIHKLLGEDMVKKLSPWGHVEQKDQFIKGRSFKLWDMLGIAQLDYLDLFQKFCGLTYGQQESYKLGHIAHVVLDTEKLDFSEYQNLMDLYEKDFQKFIEYNITDVDIVDRLEDKLGLITLVMTLAYVGGVNYTDTLGTTAIWDSIIFRDLARKYITIPQAEDHLSAPFAGGFVKEPVPGMYEWVCSFDLNSLYPSLVIQYNMSPETICPVMTQGLNPDVIISGAPWTPAIEGVITAANGAHFKSDKVGILPRIFSEMYSKRVVLKKAMIAEKKRLETIPQSDKVERFKCQREISRFENQQMAIKTLLNSGYGAISNNYFRYFDIRVAEAITLSGQLTVRTAMGAVNKYLNKMLKTDIDYVIAGDTDSVYINLKPIVDKFKPVNPTKFLDEFCSKAIEPELNKSYVELGARMGCKNIRTAMKREAIADRAIWTAKKRYILRVLNSEGVQFAEPDIQIVGIEAIKSSTPEICRDAMKEIFKTIMNGSETETQKAIAEFREKFNSAPVEDIAFPRGVSSVTKYASPTTIYLKGSAGVTPINSRAALLYNHHVKKNGLDKRYELIKNGDKMKYVYLKKQNPTNENVIGFVDSLPKELGLHQFVDLDLQFEKTFLDPLCIILDAINWKPEMVADLELFFT